MNRDEQQKQFLLEVDSLNGQFNSIRLGDKPQPLLLSFWTVDEILRGQDLRDDWDIPSHLIPFYGDWHDVMCLDTSRNTLAIQYLNDNRDVLYEWPNLESFKEALHCVEEKNTEHNDLGIVRSESWIDF